ncbi:MAG: hypothetical protein FE048_04825 [Thermoplasmata archaeon]|nr:MAG: hypothetical protein FE048_04825 [Thermoplasmata archaeon]
MNETIKFPEPDEILKEKPSIRKYIKYLAFFGPGAIVASVTIGQGQLILGPQIGAWAGFKLLWLITLSVASYIIAYVGCRFMLLSGINMMDLFAIKTKKGLLNWLFIAIIFIFTPLFIAAIVTTMGETMAWIIGKGHYLFWGILFCLLAAILAIVGRYKLVEYSQAFFVAILAIGAIISVILLKPYLLDILPNYFMIGNVPEYPEWVVREFPTVAEKPVPLIMLGYLGTLTLTIITIVSYSGWIKVKRWGIFKNNDNPDEFSQRLFSIFRKKGKITYLPEDEKEIKKSRILLKPVIVDMAIAFTIVAIASSAYMIAGAYLLGPQPDGTYRLPSDINLLKEQAVIFSNIAPWLKPLYQVSVFFALFGTVYGGFEAVSRMLYETSKSVSEKIRSLPYRKFMFYLLIYMLVTGLPLAILGYYGLSIILMLSITLLFIGVFGVIIYGIAAIYMSQKFLPEKYKMSRILLAAAIVSVMLMMVPFLFFVI